MRKNFILFVLLALTAIAKTNIATAQLNVQDSLALVDLFDSTDGPHWINHTNWLTTKPVRTWYGLTLTNDLDTRVEQLILDDNNLNGKIPASISNLAGLDYLELPSNKLYGSLPQSFSKLKNVNFVDLSNNQFTGNIPEGFGNNAMGAKYFYLSSNQFTGVIPVSIMKNYQYVYLDHNQLTGTIPDLSHGADSGVAINAFGILDLSYNRLSGSIPLIQASSLNLSHNQLTDSIPRFKKISDLDLSYNQLTGVIPIDILHISAIENFNLSHNRLTGGITGFGSLTVADFSYNHLTGTIPDSAFSFANVMGIAVINLSNNQLSGGIPDINDLGLVTLNLSHNAFTGKFPHFNVRYFICDEDGCSNTTEFRNLNLSYNQLSGSITDNVFPVDNYYDALAFSLNDIELDHNNFNDTIPAAVGNALYLNKLTLNNNQLTGKIPASIGSIKYLQALALYDNKLTGLIPKEFGRIDSLHYLYLSNNKLTGSIPDSLGNLKKLYDVDLGNNQLSGTIPSSLGNLTLLRSVALNNNLLMGTIPSSFNNLVNLVSLKLHYNQLSGTVPSLKGLNRLAKLSLRENRFTFNGLEPVQQQFGSIALYYNQAVIPLHQHTNTLAATAGGTLGNNTYTWYKDGTAYAIHTGDSTLPVTANGSYYVTVTNAVATGLTLYSDTLTATGNKPATLIALYPNPAKSNATALFNATGKYMVELTNASGKVLQTIAGTSNKAQNKVDFNISSYPQGMYFITIKDEKETRLLKLTKE